MLEIPPDPFGKGGELFQRELRCKTVLTKPKVNLVNLVPIRRTLNLTGLQNLSGLTRALIF